MRPGAVYRISCIIFKAEGRKETVYIGETGRTLFDRGLEHLRGIERDPEHPVRAHWRDCHREEEGGPQYEMVPYKFEEKNLSRQALEGFLIANFKGDIILNGRGDWGQNLPPLLTIEGDQVEKRKRKRED